MEKRSLRELSDFLLEFPIRVSGVGERGRGGGCEGGPDAGEDVPSRGKLLPGQP